MSFLDIFEDYCLKMTQINLYQRSMQQIAKKEITEIERFAEFAAGEPTLAGKPMSIQKMYFHSARHRDHYNYGLVANSIEERRTSVFLHKNKQYQWLLAEAYEEFEDFVENVYAYAGYLDNGLWPLQDYGNITLNDLSSKELEWFQGMSRKKKDVPNSIIRLFRKKFDDLRKVEVSNELGVNLGLAIALIEQFRHVIVHRGGVVGDKEEFIKRVLRKANLERNGKYDEEDDSFIRQYFGAGDYGNVIMLLEVPTDPEVPLDTYISIFDELTGYLIAYSHLLCEQFEEMQDDDGAPKFARTRIRQGITKR